MTPEAVLTVAREALTVTTLLAAPLLLVALVTGVLVGILQAAFDASVEHAKSRRQFGHAIAEFQAIQWLIADMAKSLHASRLLVRDAAQTLDRGERATLAASIAKCFASDAAVEHTGNAVQVHGGMGYVQGVEVERLYRDAKITQIWEGTNQIHRQLIGRSFMRKGRA